jgi:hypothetical protein
MIITSEIDEGSISFKDFILKFVKQEYVERRDNHLPVLPHEVKEPAFPSEQLKKYTQELTFLKNLTDEEAKIEEIKYRAEQTNSFNALIDSEKEKLRNSEKMLKQVQEWNCSESLSKLKEYLVSDIEKHICTINERINYPSFVDPEKSGEKWKCERIQCIQNIVDSYIKEVNREKAWANKTNKFLADLKENLGDW